MASHTKQDHAHPTSEFVGYIVQTLDTLTAPLPDEMSHLLNQLDGLPPEERPRHIANPTAFLRVLNFLHRNANPTMGELSHALSVPLPTATRMVSWYVDREYAERLADPSDRRIVRIALTEKGQRLHEAVDSHIERNVRRVISCLTPGEQSTLLDYLRKIAYALEKESN